LFNICCLCLDWY